MKKITIISAVSVAIYAQSALSGNVYKCEDETGNPVFTDHACGPRVILQEPNISNSPSPEAMKWLRKSERNREITREQRRENIKREKERKRDEAQVERRHQEKLKAIREQNSPQIWTQPGMSRQNHGYQIVPRTYKTPNGTVGEAHVVW